MIHGSLSLGGGEGGCFTADHCAYLDHFFEVSTLNSGKGFESQNTGFSRIVHCRHLASKL